MIELVLTHGELGPYSSFKTRPISSFYVFYQDGHDFIPRAEWKRKAGKTREPGRGTCPGHKDDEERAGGGSAKARFNTGELC